MARPVSRYALWSMRVISVLLLAIALSVATAIRPADVARAVEEPLQLHVGEVQNNYPRELVIPVEAESDTMITTISLSYRWGHAKVGNVARASFSPANHVVTQISIRTGGVAYVPPFAELSYTVTVEDQAGRQRTSEPRTFLREDTRFQWSNVQDGLLTVYYYGGRKAEAERTLRAGRAALEETARSFGVVMTEPVTGVLYNSKAEFDEALPFRSPATQRELSILGQAHPDYNLVLLQLGGEEITMRHEITHLVTHFATDNAFGSVPFWLNEGLAVYNQGDNANGYRPYLQRAIASNRLISVKFLNAMPGKADEALLGYAQGWSLVTFLVETYGPEKMAALLAAYKEGTTDDLALQKVYGFDRDGLDAAWRQWLGVPTTTAPEVVATPSQPTNPRNQPDTTARNTGSLFRAVAVGLGLISASLLALLGAAGGLLWWRLPRR